MFDNKTMIRLKCPTMNCTTLELPDDSDRAEMASVMVDHLARDGYFGEPMIDKLAAVHVEGDRTYTADLVRFLDRPVIAEGGGKRHAMRPGWVSRDGRGPAVCKSGRTVKIVIGFRGHELRATARKEPGAVQPECIACRRHLP